MHVDHILKNNEKFKTGVFYCNTNNGSTLFQNGKRIYSKENRIVIFAAGTGNPFFSTDTAATLRASELDCSLIIKATKVNGIYDSDPNINPKAKLIKNISYNDVINKDLKVMDLTAVSLAKETKIPIFVTNIFKNNSLISVLKEKGDYSKIS